MYWEAELDPRGGVDYEAFIASYKPNGPYDSTYDSGNGNATAAVGAQGCGPAAVGTDAAPFPQPSEAMQLQQAQAGSSVGPWRGASRQGRAAGGAGLAGRLQHLGSTHADAAAVLKQLGEGGSARAVC